VNDAFRPAPPVAADLAGAGALDLVNVPTRAALLEALGARLDRGEGFAVATLNLDHLVKLRRDPGFRAAYAAQSHVVADGNPVVWLCGRAGRKVDLVPGSELIAPLAALAAGRGVAMAFLGSTAPALEAAAAELEAAHPGLRIAARIAPPFGFDPEGAEADAMLDRVAASGARICLLALGAPKQEILAARGFARHPGLGFVSIGAGLDFIARHQTRAPLWVRRVKMEWFWRMATNPRRLARRYLDCALILPGLAAEARRRRGGTGEGA
jgi:N-acetylglucosaminyldiphosphoundecaprenol N-acetyl-beta-D-mannosaminyltransferase